MKILPFDKKWIFGAISIEETGAGLKPWRIPLDEYPLFETHANCKFEPLQKIISNTTGVRLEILTNATYLALEVTTDQTEADTLFDLTINNQLIKTVHLLPGKKKILFDNLPAGDKEVHIWLPVNRAVTLESLSINDSAFIKNIDDKRLKWITHGSSITHCSEASSPAKTWPAIVARKRNLNLISLGFGSGCHLDQHTARIIRDSDADFISLKIGINIIIVGSLGWRTFRSAVTGFIKTIREKHETTPIAIVSPIIAPEFENTKNNANMTLQEMRMELEDAVVRYKQVYNDDNIRFFDGIKLLPKEKIEQLDNFLHPNGKEYELMGENFVTQIFDKMISKYL